MLTQHPAMTVKNVSVLLSGGLLECTPLRAGCSSCLAKSLFCTRYLVSVLELQNFIGYRYLDTRTGRYRILPSLFGSLPSRGDTRRRPKPLWEGPKYVVHTPSVELFCESRVSVVFVPRLSRWRRVHARHGRASRDTVPREVPNEYSFKVGSWGDIVQ